MITIESQTKSSSPPFVLPERNHQETDTRYNGGQVSDRGAGRDSRLYLLRSEEVAQRVGMVAFIGNDGVKMERG